jgi:hypothetical protein
LRLALYDHEQARRADCNGENKILSDFTIASFLGCQWKSRGLRSLAVRELRC